MSEIIEKIKHTIDATIPEREEIIQNAQHSKTDYIMLILRNVFVVAAVVVFAASFFVGNAYHTVRAVGYFCGAVAYVFECLAITDCFQKKVPHSEMFMVYCFGPLYLLMGLGYIFLH